MANLETIKRLNAINLKRETTTMFNKVESFAYDYARLEGMKDAAQAEGATERDIERVVWQIEEMKRTMDYMLANAQQVAGLIRTKTTLDSIEL